MLTYDEMKDAMGLKPAFIEYLTMLIKLFNLSIEQPTLYRCKFDMQKDNTAELHFV